MTTSIFKIFINFWFWIINFQYKFNYNKHTPSIIIENKHSWTQDLNNRDNTTYWMSPSNRYFFLSSLLLSIHSLIDGSMKRVKKWQQSWKQENTNIYVVRQYNYVHRGNRRTLLYTRMTLTLKHLYALSHISFSLTPNLNLKA